MRKIAVHLRELSQN